MSQASVTQVVIEPPVRPKAPEYLKGADGVFRNRQGMALMDPRQVAEIQKLFPGPRPSKRVLLIPNREAGFDIGSSQIFLQGEVRYILAVGSPASFDGLEKPFDRFLILMNVIHTARPRLRKKKVQQYEEITETVQKTVVEVNDSLFSVSGVLEENSLVDWDYYGVVDPKKAVVSPEILEKQEAYAEALEDYEALVRRYRWIGAM